MRTASLRPVTILPQNCTAWCTKLRNTLMQLWKCITVSPLRSACLVMQKTTMKTKGPQLQLACKARWLSSEATVRARSEILAIWAALKQLSENKNDAMCIVLLRIMKRKNINMVLSFCQHWHFTWQNWVKFFRRDVLINFAQKKAFVELCINKLSDAVAKSELKANCEKFDSQLWELRTKALTWESAAPGRVEKGRSPHHRDSPG